MKLTTFNMLTLFRLAKSGRNANLPTIEKAEAAYRLGELEIEGLKTWRVANERKPETLPKEGERVLACVAGAKVLGSLVRNESGAFFVFDGVVVPIRNLQWLPIPD